MAELFELDGSHDKDPGPRRFWHPVLDELESSVGAEMTEQFALIEMFHGLDVDVRIEALRAEAAAKPKPAVRHELYHKAADACRAFNESVAEDDRLMILPVLMTKEQIDKFLGSFDVYTDDDQSPEAIAEAAAWLDSMLGDMAMAVLNYMMNLSTIWAIEGDDEDGGDSQ